MTTDKNNETQPAKRLMRLSKCNHSLNWSCRVKDASALIQEPGRDEEACLSGSFLFWQSTAGTNSQQPEGEAGEHQLTACHGCLAVDLDMISDSQRKHVNTMGVN